MENYKEKLNSLYESIRKEALTIVMDFDRKTIQPALNAMKDVREIMRRIKSKGDDSTENRFFVYEGDKLITAQKTKQAALQQMNKKRVLFSILGN